MAGLIGLTCFLSGLWFLFGMPVVVAVFAWKYRRTRTLPTGLLVAVVMLVAFYASALSLWRLFTTTYWNLSFLTTLDAAANAAKYGHPVEHGAEVLLVWLVVVSTAAAAVTGAATAAIRKSWTRRRRIAA